MIPTWLAAGRRVWMRPRDAWDDGEAGTVESLLPADPARPRQRDLVRVRLDRAPEALPDWTQPAVWRSPEDLLPAAPDPEAPKRRNAKR